MSKLGIGTSLSKAGIVTPGIVTDSLVLKHNYAAGGVVPVSDGAAYFNGDADYIELGSQSGDLRLSGSNGSISCWIKPNIVGDDHQRLIDKSDGPDGANGYSLMLHDDGTLQVNIDSSSIIAPTRVLEAQKWYYVTWTWDGTTHKLYIDGVLETSATSSAQPPSDTTNMRIGTWNHSTAREYEGYMCNVGIWNEALTQAQIKSIMWKNYTNLTDSEKTNLVSWWNLGSVIADYDTNDGVVLDNHAGLGPELINLSNSDDYGGTGESGDFVVTGTQTVTWTGNDIGNPTTSYEYLGQDLVVPVNALESGKIYKIQMISTNFQGIGSHGFSETGGTSNDLRASLTNVNATETFVSNGSAIRIFGYDANSWDATLSCKEVLGNPGDLT